MKIYRESYKKSDHTGKKVDHIIYWFDIGHERLFGIGSDIIGRIREFQTYSKELKFDHDLQHSDRYMDFNFEEVSLDEIKDANLRDVIKGLFQVGIK